MRITIPDDFTDTFGGSPDLERLKALGEVTVHSTPVADEEGVIRRLQGADIVVANRERTLFTRRVLESLPDLKLLSVTGPFFNNVDFEAATEQGIVVTRTASSSSSAVAELALGLMLAVYRRIAYGDRAIRRGDWPPLIGSELNGKTLGIVGVGNIGGTLARIAPALQMKTVAWGPVPADEEQAKEAGAAYRPLDELLSTADIISLHVRYSEMTKGMIGAREIGLMKRTAVLINTSRAGVTDEKALIAALQDGRIAGAGLDVYMEEPLPAESPLRSLDNVVMTPHVGFTTVDVQEKQARWAVDNVETYLSGEKPDVVNTEVWEKRRR